MHPRCNQGPYVLEQRLVAEGTLGRYLALREVVHPINKVRSDNRIENLMVFTNNGAHMRFHKNPLHVRCDEIVFDGRWLFIEGEEHD